jgi:hypothetical protein
MGVIRNFGGSNSGEFQRLWTKAQVPENSEAA